MYKIVKGIFIDLGYIKYGRHIPYLFAVLVQGPNGGMYLLDDYCFEQLYRKTKEFRKGGNVGKEPNYGSKKWFFTCNDIEIFYYNKVVSFSSVAKDFKAITVMRKSGYNRVMQMSKNLDI